MDHLLPTSSKVSDLRVSCFMGLVSHLAAKSEVLHVGPLHHVKPMNAVASAIVQSGTITETPLSEAGLDGSGEVIQVRTCVHGELIP